MTDFFANVEAEDPPRRVLFVCSKNQWRSPTAERVWRRHPRLEVRSGGTSQSARHTVSAEDITWADVVVVMEQKHKSKLRADFPGLLRDKAVHVLDIPDEYRFMDTELVELLSRQVAALLQLEPPRP